MVPARGQQFEARVEVRMMSTIHLRYRGGSGIGTLVYDSKQQRLGNPTS